MSRALLPEHIVPLVDRLRDGNHQAVSLPDVAALTEILMRSLESYFKSVDLKIYQECQSLADYIDDARLEISSLSPDHSDEAGIPRAGLELAAIVEQTESATNSIMESAERIMEADSTDFDSYTEVVSDAVMQIFEACSFQDITGQRISKVVNTLEYVEDRVAKLINILGIEEGNIAPAPVKESDENKDLLHGPSLEGEGIDQAEVDALLNFKNSDETKSKKKKPVIEKNPSEEADTDNIADPAADVKTKTNSETPDQSNSDDIDFMFDGQSEDPEPSNGHTQKDLTEAQAEIVAEVAPSDLNLIEKAKKKKAAALAQQKARVKPLKPVIYEEDAKAGLNPKTTENTTQSDIDALFS